MSTSLSRRRRFGVSVALGGALGVALTVGTAAFAADYDNLVPFVPPGAIEHGMSNGLIESVNTKIRLITRMAFGFASPDALIALAMLNLGGHRPTLPGRQ